MQYDIVDPELFKFENVFRVMPPLKKPMPHRIGIGIIKSPMLCMCPICEHAKTTQLVIVRKDKIRSIDDEWES